MHSETVKFLKIRPAGTELFHADRRTDMTKLKAVFRRFVEQVQKGGECGV
jgi:hypothetical protein